MKYERFSIQNKGELFEKASPMHDCSFTASYENETLVLHYEGLDSYRTPEDKPFFDGFQRVTVRYLGVRRFDMQLKFGKKEKDHDNTLAPINGKENSMFCFSIDSFNTLTLTFRVMIKKKLWGGRITMFPKEVEYLWE